MTRVGLSLSALALVGLGIALVWPLTFRDSAPRPADAGNTELETSELVAITQCIASPIGFPAGTLGCSPPQAICGLTERAPDGFCCVVDDAGQVLALVKPGPNWDLNKVDPDTRSLMKKNSFNCGPGHYDTWENAKAAALDGGDRGPGWTP